MVTMADLKKEAEAHVLYEKDKATKKDKDRHGKKGN